MNNKISKIYLKNIVWLSTLTIFFLVDRYLKILILKTSTQPIIGNVLNFNFVPNYQIAFSLPLSGPLLNILISLIITGVFSYVCINYKHLKQIELTAFIGIILGAISNLIDRFKYGFVIDYLDLRWFTIFNLADVLISVCSVILFISLIKKDSK